MFKNAQVDPLAIPPRAVSRRSVGPTHRIANDYAGWHDEPGGPSGDGNCPECGGDVATGQHDPHCRIGNDPMMRMLGRRTADVGPAATAPATDGGSGGAPAPAMATPDTPAAPAMTPMAAPAPAPDVDTSAVTAAAVPRKVAVVLDREARAFLDREGTTDDRSELLYRARRHAGAFTSTWSREASQKATEAFCGRVAAMIPSRPRVAAAQSPSTFEDFDDALLY